MCGFFSKQLFITTSVHLYLKTQKQQNSLHFQNLGEHEQENDPIQDASNTDDPTRDKRDTSKNCFA